MKISKIKSLLLGKIQTIDNQWITASFKQPITTSVEVTHLGLVGDSVADTKYHGGINKAIFANSSLNYSVWSDFLGVSSLDFGSLAENITLDSIDESHVYIGDIHKIGDVILEVSQPREPCWKISQRFNNNEFTNHIYNTGRTGWYYRVLEVGKIQKDMEIELISRVENSMSILNANKILREPNENLVLANKLLDLDVLSQAWKNSLMKKLKEN